MRLSIIQPSHYRSKSDRSILKIKKRRLTGLTLPYLAALTPAGWDISLIDEQLTDIDFDAPVDLAAITTWTINSLRAYEIADNFRRRGVPVIMGGPHTYFYPEESAAHCDAVGIGEGENIWPAMLDDFANGRLRKLYSAPHSPDLADLPMPRYDLLDFSRYTRIKTYSVQSSRGCPFECEFCSERFYLGHRYRYRPVADVIAEIRRTGAHYILFADSNFAGKPSHTKELDEGTHPSEGTLVRPVARLPLQRPGNDEPRGEKRSPPPEHRHREHRPGDAHGAEQIEQQGQAVQGDPG